MSVPEFTHAAQLLVLELGERRHSLSRPPVGPTSVIEQELDLGVGEAGEFAAAVRAVAEVALLDRRCDGLGVAHQLRVGARGQLGQQVIIRSGLEERSSASLCFFECRKETGRSRRCGGCLRHPEARRVDPDGEEGEHRSADLPMQAEFE